MSTRYFCDTDCELWFTDVDRLNIEVIRMPYTLDDKEYYYDFGRETDFDNFYKRMREGATPTTSALNEYNYTEMFEPVFAGGDDIFYIAFSSNLSATFNFMKPAVDKLLKKYPKRKFTHFDTKSISMGAGIQVYYAMELRNKGASDEEVLAFLQSFTNRVQTLFAVDDLNHLKRGGRVSGAAAVFGTMLNLKPIITITDDGKLQPIAKVKGNVSVERYFVDAIKKYGENFDKYDIWIMQADCEDRAEKLRAKVDEATGGNAKIHTILVGPVIGAHCGAGTLGIIFPAKHR